MMPPDALQGWAPSFGQWCSFAIASLRWTGSTYPFRAHIESIQPVAIRLELFDRLAGAFVRRVDEHFVPLSDSRHDDITEFIIVTMRQSRRKQKFRSTEIHLISIGDLDFLGILLQRPDERARALLLTPIDVELPVLQEREL